jgi:solute carrier family 25 phosphate transporter 3
MVGDPSYAKENLISALVRIIREDGVLKTFTGLSAMLSKQIPYTMTKQVSFDIIAKMLYGVAEKANFKAADIKIAISILAAFLSSILSCLGSQPGDMILTAFYKNHGAKSFLAIISEIYGAHGLAGFYLGTIARLMHVSLIITSQLVLYDIVKQALGLKASGSH